MLNDGLIGHWTMDDRDTSEGQIKDRSAHDNHGTITGTTTTGHDSIVGESFRFYPTGGNVGASNNYPLNHQGDITYSFWINFTPVLTNWFYACSFGSTTTSSVIIEGNRDVQFSVEKGGIRESTRWGPLPQNEWVHVACTHDVDTGVSQVYQNGTLLGESTLTAGPRDVPGGFDIGDGRTDRIDGRISDVRLYDRVLTSDEIQRLSNARTNATARTKPYDLRSQPGDGGNLMDASVWTRNTIGDQGPFNDNGSDVENSIVKGVGPYGDIVNLWYARSEDDDSGVSPSTSADGGWNWRALNDTDIDPTKLYRYSVWVRQEATGGNVYHGTERVDEFDGVYDSNPYYFNGDLPTTGDWYLMVGYNHPEGTPDGNMGAIYDSNGEKIRSITDYRWDIAGGTDSISFRSYYYYDPSFPSGAHFYDPRVDICDGTEPSIADLTQPANDFSDGRTRHWIDVFDEGNLNKWTVNAASIVQDRVNDGLYAAKFNTGVANDYEMRTEPFDGGRRISKFEMVWQETSANSTGGGARFRNSDGTIECGIATDNPEWDVEDANGITPDINTGAGYDQWTRFTVTFDWDAGTFDLDLAQPSSNTAHTATGRPLVAGEDVQFVELWEYNGGTWGGSYIDMWIDSVEVHG